MSESTNADFSVPVPQDFDTQGYQGSMQQILQQNIGNYVTVEFLVGTNTLITRQGLLYAVGSQYMVLFDDLNLRYEVCDIFTVKFVTFLLPGYRPGQSPSSSEQSAPSSAMTKAQAAYAHASRRQVRT